MSELSSNVISVTQLFQLTNYGISLNDVNWIHTKMTSDRMITVLHSFPYQLTSQISSSASSPLSLSSSASSAVFNPQLYRHSYDFDDKINSDARRHSWGIIGSLNVNGSKNGTKITLINPYSNEVINCCTSTITASAAVNPYDDTIALSNVNCLAVYCLKTGICLKVSPLYWKCHFWTWINKDMIAIVTDTEVLHWNCSSYVTSPHNEPICVFKRDEKMKNYQITNYKCDKMCQSWYALLGLNVDDEGEITGMVQIYSHAYRHTHCIDAHAINFTTYKFNGNERATNVLLAAKRTPQNHAKIYIIELGPVMEGNSALVTRTEVIQWSDPCDGKYDIPVSIECSYEWGLVYILSKYGAMYISDIESGALLCHSFVSTDIIFASVLDYTTQGLIAISRNGQVMSIELYLPYLIEHTENISKKNIADRLKRILDERSDVDIVTRL